MTTRRRYKLDHELVLEASDGSLLRVVSVTLEKAGAVGGIGGGGFHSSSTAGGELQRQEHSEPGEVVGEGENAARTQTEMVEGVWAHYQATFPNTRRDFNEKRKRIIRTALKVRTVEECKLAITGLKHSPWHNGDNPNRKNYLDIRYALAGIGDESADDRIDKMIEQAPANDAGQVQVAQIKVDRRVDLLRRYVKSGNTFEPTRARRAYAELVEWGFTVARLKQHPWVEIARAA